MSRAREALAARVEETSLDMARAGVGMGLSQMLGAIAFNIRRGTETGDREARRMIELLPVITRDGAGDPLLSEGALLEWFDLMVRVEAMDRLLDGDRAERGPEVAVTAGPEGMAMINDGDTRGRLA